MKRMSLKDVRVSIFYHEEELDRVKSGMFELPERTRLKCEDCGWLGTKKELVTGRDHADYMVYSCPDCLSLELEYRK